jgi:hypothetical protein
VRGERRRVGGQCATRCTAVHDDLRRHQPAALHRRTSNVLKFAISDLHDRFEHRRCPNIYSLGPSVRHLPTGSSSAPRCGPPSSSSSATPTVVPSTSTTSPSASPTHPTTTCDRNEWGSTTDLCRGLTALPDAGETRAPAPSAPRGAGGQRSLRVANNGDGEGGGIDPGALSWVTLQLEPSHYELECNLPGHYAAGMYTELDVR